jgi:uncharacterized protein YecE (DUF72 family)
MNFHIGTSGYSYKEWKGSFYPEKLAAKQMLSFYGKQFRAVEINYTFTQRPTAALLEGWASEVPAHFQFALKAPQQITHFRRLKGVGRLISSFLSTITVLKERLGPVLFQLPPNFKKDLPLLRKFLVGLRQRCRAAIEFRHASWFDDKVFELLNEHQVALCIADAGDDLDVPFVSTTDWSYLRLRRPDYDDAALKEWVKQIRAQIWKDCFVFFKHEETGTGPLLAMRLLKLLTKSTH